MVDRILSTYEQILQREREELREIQREKEREELREIQREKEREEDLFIH